MAETRIQVTFSNDVLAFSQCRPRSTWLASPVFYSLTCNVLLTSIFRKKQMNLPLLTPSGNFVFLITFFSGKSLLIEDSLHFGLYQKLCAERTWFSWHKNFAVFRDIRVRHYQTSHCMDAITGTIDSAAHVVRKNEHSSNFLGNRVFSWRVIWETFHPEQEPCKGFLYSVGGY